MSKNESKVVAQFPWAAVKERLADGLRSFDVWQWNLYKRKWVRLTNSACGFGKLADASITAKNLSEETQAMLDNNRDPPPPL